MEKIDFNILNALNLINPALADAYREKGYNPFDDEFVLQNQYVQKLLENAKLKENILAEDFLNQGNKEIAEIFNDALIGTQEIETELSNNKNVDKKKFKEILIFLKNRQELLSQAIEKLANINADSFLLYKDIVGIDAVYSEIMKATFYKNFNKQIIIENFLKHCRKDNKSKKIEQQKQVEKLLNIKNLEEDFNEDILPLQEQPAKKPSKKFNKEKASPKPEKKPQEQAKESNNQKNNEQKTHANANKEDSQKTKSNPDKENMQKTKNTKQPAKIKENEKELGM